MASSPQSIQRDPADFRAPPPSPVAASRRPSSVANDNVLMDFLDHSLRVPDLVLPDRLFPRLLPSGADVDMVVPAVDFSSLTTAQGMEALELARDALERTGCFQLLNHGVSPDMLRAAVDAATGIFRLPPETKKAVERSAHHMQGFGFEEVAPAAGEDDYYHDHDDHIDLFEEFVWCNHPGLRLKMEQIWPNGYSIFREQMEKLSSSIEEVSRGIMEALMELDDPNSITARGEGLKDSLSSVCYINKHPNDIPVERCVSSFRYDVIRMMIRGSDYPHALSLHVCGEGCSEFHVYSKKGWVSFTPAPNAFVVTAGDQIQGWSGGQYKHVIGRPIYRGDQQGNNFISMAFLCSPCTSSTGCTNTSTTPNYNLEENQKMITLHQQALFVALFTIACQFLLFVYHKL